MVDDGLQRSRFGKEMARTRNDLQSLRPLQPRQCLLVEFDDAEIGASDNKEGRCPNSVEGITGKIRTAAARYHSAHTTRKFRRSDECSRSPGAGAEQSKWKLCEGWLPVQPVDSVYEPDGQQRNVEDVGPISLFVRGEKIK